MNDQVIIDFVQTARSAKLKCVIEMALDFTAMVRKFSKGSSPRIHAKLEEFLGSIGEVTDQVGYDRRHAKFCEWFTKHIQIAERTVGKKKRTIPAHPSSFGHAAKVLDIVAKVYFLYCSLPSPEVADRLLPFLHGGLDNQIIQQLIGRFGDSGVVSKNLEDVDDHKYAQLQAPVCKQIREDFGSLIHPVQFDDILFRKLNRRGELAFQIVLGAEKSESNMISRPALSGIAEANVTD